MSKNKETQIKKWEKELRKRISISLDNISFKELSGNYSICTFARNLAPLGDYDYPEKQAKKFFNNKKAEAILTKEEYDGKEFIMLINKLFDELYTKEKQNS